jgi:molybdopterin molybdotransferase
MSLLSLSEARAVVIAEVKRALAQPRTESVVLAASAGRVLAEDIRADRDQPPFPRSTRDGFAVRAADLAAPGQQLRVIGEVAAGASFAGDVSAGEAVEIMTGAPVPMGADAVVMIEHTERTSPGTVVVNRLVRNGENVDAVACRRGVVLDPAAIALLASLGCAKPLVFARPRIAVVSTGDELVAVEATPSLAQIRDSNRHCLAASVAEAGGEAIVLPIVRDDRAAIEATLAEAAAAADLVLITGGVSMGKYDHVESALATLSARVIFDGVAIRPGKPLVFGFLAGKPFFGLPGNPLSAMVTFKLFARAAIALCGGQAEAPGLPISGAQLASPYTQKSVPLTVFAPARLVRPGPTEPALSALLAPARVAPVSSQGSGDLAAMAIADGYLAIEPGVTEIPAGSWAAFLPK